VTKLYPIFPKFILMPTREILHRLRAPTGVIRDQTLPNFPQIHSRAHEGDTTWLGTPNQCNIVTYYVGWDLPTNVVSSLSLQSFQISNFYFFPVFLYIDYLSNRRRIWYITPDLCESTKCHHVFVYVSSFLTDIISYHRKPFFYQWMMLIPF